MADQRSVNDPAWTEYKKKNGLDPLGMQNSAVNLYQTFLPGISNVTLRMRYYGLYAWLCRTYARNVGETDPESWKRFIRRAEAAYALIARWDGGESGVAGIEWAQGVLDANDDDPIDFARAAEPGSEDHYLKQAWGAYGAAYRSQLFEIGIFDASDTHDLPLPSQDVGERLASAFEQGVGDGAGLFYEIIQRGSVNRGELDRLSALAPSEIGLTGDERAAYQQLLLSPVTPGDERAHARRRSVLLILRIAALLGRDPAPDEVRWILYAGCDPEGRALTLQAPELQAQRRLWWVYHANDLCHVAFETLLKFTLDTLGENPHGVTLARLIPACVDKLLTAAEDESENWATFVGAVQPAANAYSEDETDSEWSLTAHIMPHAGRSDERICEPETAWKAVMLLAVLHRRLQDEDRGIETTLGGPDAKVFLRSLLTETRFLDRHAETSFRETLARLIEERVVHRHLSVALQKLRAGDYTFLIEMDEGKLRLREKDGPVFTNPRLGPAITFLKDIHLVGGKGLTDLGTAAMGGA